jgi:ATP-binding cassette subfamily C (CFTR/MRP) protein 1
MSTDANRADEIFNILSSFCNLSLNFTCTFLVLLHYFGWALLSGIFFAAFTFKVNQYFLQKNKTLRKEKERLADRKKNLLTEVLNNIKMLKLFGWEASF